jgi:hypothetical protein
VLAVYVFYCIQSGHFIQAVCWRLHVKKHFSLSSVTKLIYLVNWMLQEIWEKPFFIRSFWKMLQWFDLPIKVPSLLQISIKNHLYCTFARSNQSSSLQWHLMNLKADMAWNFIYRYAFFFLGGWKNHNHLQLQIVLT